MDTNNTDTDSLQLGGNIQLTGFSALDRGQMVVLKKIVGNYAKRLSQISSNFEELSLTMKPVHETEANKMYELHAKLMDNGKPIVSEITDRNLFVAIDSVLKKIENNYN
jgi:ribosome-associated translation inhibitor RaiA